MRPDGPNPAPKPLDDVPGVWSRRRFLGVGARVVAGGLALRAAATDDTRLVLPPGAPRSRVIRIRSDAVLEGNAVHSAILREMLHAALLQVTQTETEKQAWHTLLDERDIVGLKFNQSGRELIGTAPAMATVLVESLKESGWPPDRIVCIEVPEEVCEKLGTRVAPDDYDAGETEFGSGADEFASVLNQVTAIINVPFLKNHNLAVITGAMKNLSHGLVKHPARYHANGCSPYITDIVAAPTIRKKLRLHLMDALRVVFEGGPLASAATIQNAGFLIASRDPVALDTIGLGVLNDVRRARDLPPLAESGSDIPFLATSHRRGLGIAVRHGIDLVEQRLP